MTDVVHDLRIGLKELAAEDRAGWLPLALSDRVRDVVGLRESTEIELIRSLAEWDRTAAWSEDGAVTAIAWMKHNLDMAPGEATGLFHLARFYDQHRALADALDGHRLSAPPLGCCCGRRDAARRSSPPASTGSSSWAASCRWASSRP